MKKRSTTKATKRTTRAKRTEHIFYREVELTPVVIEFKGFGRG